MRSLTSLDDLHLKFNGPISNSHRLRAIFIDRKKIGDTLVDKYECTRTQIMIRHYTKQSISLLKLIRKQKNAPNGKLRRHFEREELSLLLRQRRVWKNYYRSLNE